MYKTWFSALYSTASADVQVEVSHCLTFFHLYTLSFCSCVEEKSSSLTTNTKAINISKLLFPLSSSSTSESWRRRFRGRKKHARAYLISVRTQIRPQKQDVVGKHNECRHRIYFATTLIRDFLLLSWEQRQETTATANSEDRKSWGKKLKIWVNL